MNFFLKNERKWKGVQDDLDDSLWGGAGVRVSSLGDKLKDRNCVPQPTAPSPPFIPADSWQHPEGRLQAETAQWGPSQTLGENKGLLSSRLSSGEACYVSADGQYSPQHASARVHPKTCMPCS